MSTWTGSQERDDEDVFGNHESREDDGYFSKREAFVIMRFFVRLEQQISDAMVLDRMDHAKSLAKLAGELQYKIFDSGCYDPSNECRLTSAVIALLEERTA